MRGGGLPGSHPMADVYDHIANTANFFYNTVIFLKAGVVGLDRVYRGFSTDPNRMAIAMKTGAVALAGLALYAANRDNPIYQDLPDWDKNSNFHVFLRKPDVPDTAPLREQYYHFRIPRPWEVGGIAAIFERGVDDALNGKYGEMPKHFYEIVMNMLRNNIIPQAIQPLYEQATNNLNFFNRPIENEGEQSLPPWMRAQNASQGLRWLGQHAIRYLPRDMQISPDRIEALLRGYFNTAAAYGLQLIDGVFFDDAPAMRLDQYPVLHSIISTNPGSKFTQQFYDMLQAATEARRASRELYRQHANGIANQETLSTENFQYAGLNATAHALQRFSSLQRRISDAQDMGQIQKMALSKQNVSHFSLAL